MAMNMGTFQMALRLAQLGEEIERVENPRTPEVAPRLLALPKNDRQQNKGSRAQAPNAAS